MSIEVRKHAAPKRQSRPVTATPAQKLSLINLMVRNPLWTLAAIAALVIFADPISHLIEHVIISILPGVMTLAVFLLGGAWTIGKLRSLFR